MYNTSRLNKTKKNILLAVLYQCCAIICGLIVPRLLLSNFGSTYNGVINSVTHFLDAINILTIGISGSTRVVLYKYLNNSESHEEISRVIKATDMYMKKVALSLLGYVIILIFVYPFISNNNLTYIQNILIISIMAIGLFSQYYFSIPYMILLQSDQSSYITYIFDIIKIVMNLVVVWLFISLDCSIFIVKFASSLVYLLIPILMKNYVVKQYHLNLLCEPNQEGIKNRSDVAFLSIANFIHNNIDFALLTFFVDAKLISVYCIFYQILSQVKSLMRFTTVGIESLFGSMWAKNEFENIFKYFKCFELLSFSFISVIFSCSIVLIMPFISIYTRGVTDIEYYRVDIAIVLILAEIFYCARQPYMILVQAAGKYKETKWGSAFEAIMNLILSVVLVCFYDVIGVIIGTIIANVFRTLQYAIFVSGKLLPYPFKKVVLRFLWMFVCILVSSLLSGYIINNTISLVDWVAWIESGIISLGISTILCVILALMFYKNDLFLILNVAKKMILKR